MSAGDTCPVDTPQPARYPRRAVILHWIVALLIIALLASGWTMVAWRVRHEVPTLPASMPRWERGAAVLNHWLFYILMVLVTLAGYLTSSFSKYGPKLFGIPLPHWGWEDAALRGDFAAVHRVAGLVFAVLIVLHVAAALKHLLWDRDGVFQRMMPGAKMKVP